MRLQSEYDELLPTLAEAELKVVNQLVPREAIDEGNAVLEIRAGTGVQQLRHHFWTIHAYFQPMPTPFHDVL